MKMCKKTNKCLFMAGIGMQMLVHFCSVGYQSLRVINGNERGTPLEELYSFDPKRVTHREDVFMDLYSGDYFHFNPDSQVWMPSGNVGLHSSTAIDFENVANQDNLKKTKTYKVNLVKNASTLHLSKLYDVKCQIKKQHIKHWALINLPSSFVVTNTNRYDPHPINITQIQHVCKNYETIAESERGPQIAEHVNSLALQFNIDRKIAETLIIV